MAAVALVAGARLVAFWRFPLCAEDFYITAHAAIDPAWCRATTSPLWSLLVGIWGGPPVWARALTLVGDCAAVWAAWKLLTPWGLGAFLALWLSPFFTGSAVSGLETHMAACALIVGKIHPAGYSLAAALRPDTAALALVVSWRKWLWAVAGAACLLLIGWACSGNPLPQTISSKLHTYGAQGLAIFWWYRVAPFALIGFWVCKHITRPIHLGAAVLALAFWAGPSWNELKSRTDQERELWKAGEVLAALKLPSATLMLEPAGMIPYLNPQMEVVDEVGLLDPWMAKRRSTGEPGWRADALARYRPRFLILRLREYMYPGQWGIGSEAYRDSAESMLSNYGVVALPGMKVEKTDPAGGRVQVTGKLISSNLAILMRKKP